MGTNMQTTDRIRITMPPEMMRLIRESVKAGEFASINETMRDAVRVWQRQRLEDAGRLQAIRERVNRSLGDPRPDLSHANVEERFRGVFANAMACPDATV